MFHRIAVAESTSHRGFVIVALRLDGKTPSIVMFGLIRCSSDLLHTLALVVFSDLRI